jgi:hypothetical protein
MPRLDLCYADDMKAVHIGVLIAAAALTGCASMGAQTPETPCAALNREMGDKAKDISAVAVSRGNVDAVNVPFWVPGGTKAVSVITNRQTAKIEKLQAEQAEMYAARENRCRSIE